MNFNDYCEKYKSCEQCSLHCINITYKSNSCTDLFELLKIIYDKEVLQNESNK